MWVPDGPQRVTLSLIQAQSPASSEKLKSSQVAGDVKDWVPGLRSWKGTAGHGQMILKDGSLVKPRVRQTP